MNTRLLGLALLLSVTLVGLFGGTQVSTAAAPSWQLLTADGAANSPPPRASSTNSAWDTQANRLLVFGGDDGAHNTYHNDLWSYSSGGGWRVLTANGAPGSPPIRTNHVVVWDSQANRLLVFGGVTTGPTFRNDLWEYTMAGGWRLLTADGAPGSPSRRDDFIGVWDSQANRLLIFGGRAYASEPVHVYNDLWEYTAGGWRLLTADGATGSPPPRHSHAAAWDSQTNRLLVFGGNLAHFATTLSTDVWQYTAVGGWQMLVADAAPGSPPARMRHAAAWDTQRNRMLVFGGQAFSPDGGSWWWYSDLWSYTPAGGWLLLTASGAAGAPAARQDATVAWDRQTNRLLVFAGYDGRQRNDLWQFQHVTYPFQGFFAPVDNPPTVNVVHAGRTLLLQWSLGGVAALSSLVSLQSVAVSCASLTGAEDPVDTVTTGNSSFRYDAATDRFSYNWQTSSTWAGTCRQLVLTLDDGTTHTASFKFR